MRRSSRLAPPAVLGASFLVGSLPFSGLAARVLAGVDLRRVGTGTVSGTGLYRVAGFGPLAAAGVLDVAKGAIGPWLAGPDRRVLGAASAAATVCGHNWSPFLKGAGGRGISPALGALGVLAPEGSALLLGGLVVGRLLGQSGVGSLAALAGMPWLLGRRRGWVGGVTAAAVGVPMVVKRLVGNRRPASGRLARVLLWRLVLDRDPAALGGAASSRSALLEP